MIKIHKTHVKNTDLFFLSFNGKVIQLEPKKDMTDFPVDTFHEQLMFIPNIGSYVTPDKIEVHQHYQELNDKLGTVSLDVPIEELSSSLNS